MGYYLNPGSESFRMSLRSPIYVDKTKLIQIVNQRLCTSDRYLCVSRPRRFGKTMALDMLAAYYGLGEDTSSLFDGFAIAQSGSYQCHINKYDVIRLDMTEFLHGSSDMRALVRRIDEELGREMSEAYPDHVKEGADLIKAMRDLYIKGGHQFVVLIDEWDCLFREYKGDKVVQREYLDYLRALLKDKPYIALAYMTGILPIRKYGTHSALNMFREYSMTSTRELSPFFGFTEEEVDGLCVRYGMARDEVKAWYDGYEMIDSCITGDIHYSIYNPKSVVEALQSHVCENYWVRTESYEALEVYISMNFDGLRDSIVRMLGGEEVSVDTTLFNNDLAEPGSANEVLNILIQLGYLSYSFTKKTVRIPNREIKEEYISVISKLEWEEIRNSVLESKKLLEAIWNQDAETLALGLEKAHERLPLITYNDENSLACTLRLALYAAEQYYSIFPELGTGKGVADLVLVPRRKYADKPAIVVELKWDKSVSSAIAQIKAKDYPARLAEYRGDIILCGTSYDKRQKAHKSGSWEKVRA